MKGTQIMRKITIVFITIFMAAALYGQNIAGQWNGILSVQGMQLRIIFHITKTDQGYHSTMDSPDQGAKDIPVSSTRFNNPNLEIQLSNLGIEFSGSLNEANNIEGTFKQAGQSFPLTLSRKIVPKEKIIRPQEPIKPYPYYSEEVQFANPKAKIELAGTLTLPKNGAIFPAVVLISGSGAQNRDEEIMGHKPFLVLADYLTKQGIGVLRFDDRGTAKSTGNFKTATSFDFSTDVEAAVQYLLTRKEIDKNKIGLIGHSEGGIIAPMVAARTKAIRFIVLLAGTGISGEKLLLLQQKAIGKASGMSDAELEKVISINKGAFEIVSKSMDDESGKAKLTTYLKRTYKDLPESNKPKGIKENDFIKLQVSQLTSPWMQFFLKYDPVPTLEKVKCPVLALNGSKDLQVPAKINLKAIEQALQKGGNTNYVIKELPKLNHLFQECETGLPIEYAKIEQTVSPKALNEIRIWILKTLK